MHGMAVGPSQLLNLQVTLVPFRTQLSYLLLQKVYTDLIAQPRQVLLLCMTGMTHLCLFLSHSGQWPLRLHLWELRPGAEQATLRLVK